MQHIKFVIFLLLVFSKVIGQQELDFSQSVASCEEKWVVCLSEDDSSYQFGFVFATKGGITFRLEGAFTIDGAGKYVRVSSDKVNQKVALTGGNSIVALLPENKFTELSIGKFPSWYDKETNVSGSIVEIFTKGVVFNAKGEYDKAVIFLQEAYLINPDYTNLRYQLAKALNGTKAFDKAIVHLQDALKTNSNSYELYQELSYAKIKTGDIVGGEEAASKGIKLCELNTEKCQMAVNVAVYYFEKKDRKKFDEWVKTANKYVTEGGRHFKQISTMSAEAKKW